MARKKSDVVVKKFTDEAEITADNTSSDVGMNVIDVFEPTSTVVAKEDVQQQIATPEKTRQKDESSEKKWYIVHTYSGYENKVKTDLEKRIEYMNMADKIFKIEVCNLHWIDGKMDDPEDLCLHGNIFVVAGNHKLEYKDATVSSSALYFLKSITENHIFGKDNQMLPCCGFLYYPDKKKENISICGCPNGVDWTIKHKKSQVLFIFENGEDSIIAKDEERYFETKDGYIVKILEK